MSEENVNPVDPAAFANANRNFLLARDDVEEIDGAFFGPRFEEDASREAAIQFFGLPEEKDGFFSRVIDTAKQAPLTVGRVMQEGYRAATREPALDIEEAVPQIDSAKGILSFVGTMLAASPQEVATIMRKIDPDSRLGADKDGFLVIRSNDKNYYLNKPGMSQVDIARLAMQTASFAPAARISAWGRSLKKQAIRFGASAGVTSIALDKLVNMAGGEKGLASILKDATKIGVTSPLYFLGAGLATSYLRSILRNPDFVKRTSDGRVILSTEGRKAANKEGIDIDELEEDLMENLFNELQRQQNPQRLRPSVNVATGRSLGGKGVQLTRHQANLPYDTGKVSAMHQAGRGVSKGGEVAKAFISSQEGELKDAAEYIVGKRNPTEASSIITQELKTKYDEMVDNVQEQYRRIGNLDILDTAPSFQKYLYETPVITSQGQEVDFTRYISGEEFNVPKTNDVLRLIRNLEDATTPKVPMGFSPDTPRAATVYDFNKLINLREQINSYWRVAKKGGPEKLAIGHIRRSLDQYLDHLETNALFNYEEGDPEALFQLKQATAARRAVGVLFDESAKSNATRKITEWALLDPTPEEVATYLFASAKGNVPSAQTAAMVNKLKDIFLTDGKPNSQAWPALKEAVFNNAVMDRNGFKGASSVIDIINELEQNHPTIWNELYTASDRKQFLKLREVATLTLDPKDLRPGKEYQTEKLAREIARSIGQRRRLQGRFAMGMGWFIAARMKLPFVQSQAGTTLWTKKLLGPPPIRRTPSTSVGIPLATVGTALTRSDETELPRVYREEVPPVRLPDSITGN